VRSPSLFLTAFLLCHRRAGHLLSAFHGPLDESRLHLPVLEKPILGEVVAVYLEDWSRQREDAFASEIGEDGWIAHVTVLEVDSEPFQVSRHKTTPRAIGGFV